MSTEGSDLAVSLTRQLRLIIHELGGLSDEVLNRELPFQPSNTLFQLGFHVAGSARWWSITNTGGRDFHRNRPAEFVATGTGATLFTDYEVLIGEVEEQLNSLTPAQLDRPSSIPEAGMSHWVKAGPQTQRDGVLHSIEHTGLHLGHMQITRQLFGFAPPSDGE